MSRRVLSLSLVLLVVLSALAAFLLVSAGGQSQPVAKSSNLSLDYPQVGSGDITISLSALGQAPLHARDASCQITTFGSPPAVDVALMRNGVGAQVSLDFRAATAAVVYAQTRYSGTLTGTTSSFSAQLTTRPIDRLDIVSSATNTAPAQIAISGTLTCGPSHPIF